MLRSKVYTTYKKFKNIKETPGNLLKQQQFLQTYIDENYDKIDKMLLFHGIGTGKTCTSITIAEKIMSIDSKKKVLVILPARLKTNYIDELISSNCGFYKYISKEDYDKFLNSKTPLEEISKIRLKFEKKIAKNYTIISYEKLRSTIVKSTNIKNTLRELTEDKIIIIDEVHNLISNGIKPEILDKIKKENKITKTHKNINGIILRLLTSEAEKTCKMFFLTATPVFDNYNQFIELVLNLRPDIKLTGKENIQKIIHLIKGKVSFYSLNDRSLFPSVEYKNIEIPISETQDEEINEIILANENDDPYGEKSESFCVKQRQLCISVFDKSKKSIIFKDIKEYAPKLNVLYGSLATQPGKHLVYSNFIKYCLELIAEYLKSKGWNDFIKDGSKKNKTFVIWDSSLNDKDKSRVKNVLNSVDNIDGNKIKVILGSPSIKEGISFKHIQQMHQIDPVWNSSAKDQIEGRCIRYKSHEEIPLNHPKLRRTVVISNYIATARDDGLIEETCDERIYNEIIPAKKFIISKIEKLLKKVSFDYFLFGTTNKPTKIDSKSSVISISPELIEYLKAKQPKEKLAILGCPVPRRPIDGKCKDPNYIIKLNKHEVECCYKKTKKDLNKEKGIPEKVPKEKKSLKSDKVVKKTKADEKSPKESKVSRCPVNRIPVNGKCKDPNYIVKNKNGRECCYKKTKKDL